MPTRPIRTLVLTLLSLAAACAHGGDDTLRVEPGAAAETADRVEDDLDLDSTALLTGPDGVGVGDADLSRFGDGWRLEIEVEPPEGAAGWRAFVVRGSCALPSGQVVQLSRFAADGEAFESVTDFPTAWLKEGTSYAITIDDGEGNRVACGELAEP